MIIERQEDNTIKINGQTTDIIDVDVFGHTVKCVYGENQLYPVEIPEALTQVENYGKELSKQLHNPGLWPGD